MRPSVPLLIAALASCTSTTPGEPSPTDTADTAQPLSDGPSLWHLEFFQVVSVPVLWEGAEPLERTAPLVADRAAVLRASVVVPPGWQTADVTLAVTVQHDGTSDTFTQTGALSGDGTLRVTLPAEAIDGDATYDVALAVGGSAQLVDRFPASGEARINAEVTGPIKIHLVPFELNGFVPDLSPAIIEGYRDAVFATYPTTEVIITVGEVIPAPSDSLKDLLVDVGIQQEQIDKGPWDTYYYGMATGVATREEFDGVTGSSQEIDYRAGFAIGAAFGDQTAEDTLIHELGHLHFLKHADCGGAGNTDPDFPYSGGGIGTEGYDVRTDSFIDSDGAYDMMGYCYPRWISDYHYGLLVDWVQHSQGW